MQHGSRRCQTMSNNVHVDTTRSERCPTLNNNVLTIACKMRSRRTFAAASRFQTARAENSAAASRIQTTRAIGTFAVVLFITALQAHARQASRHTVNWTTINIQGGYINRIRTTIINITHRKNDINITTIDNTQ